jgi:hypothetical protein
MENVAARDLRLQHFNLQVLLCQIIQNQVADFRPFNRAAWILYAACTALSMPNGSLTIPLMRRLNSYSMISFIILHAANC